MNPWKIGTIGIAAALVTALTASLTTAYLVRPTMMEQVDTAYAPAPRAARLVAARYPTTDRVVTSSTRVATPPVAPASANGTITRVPTPVALPTGVSVPADCETGTDRALRIAKPGALGTLLGAGLGAAGGAIAGGGTGAGKGALIGGIAGAAVGTGYGAYKTKTECGTIFGSRLTDELPRSVGGAPARATQPISTAAGRTDDLPQAALRSGADGIQIFNAR